MRRWRPLQLIALIAAAGCAALAWHGRRTADAERADLAAVTAQIAAAQNRDRTLAQKDAEIARYLAMTAAAAPRGAASGAPSKTLLQRLREDPKLQLQILAGNRHRSAIQYAPLFAALKLTPDQSRQFLDNLMKRDSALMDLQATQADKGLAGNDPAPAELRRQINDEYEAVQQGFLGADGSRQLESFEQNSFAQTIVGNIAGTAAAAGAPLDPGQVQQFVAAIAAAQRHVPGDAYAAWPQLWPQIAAQAQAFLTPDQLDLAATAERISAYSSGGPFGGRLNSLVTKYGNEEAAAAAGGESVTPAP